MIRTRTLAFNMVWGGAYWNMENLSEIEQRTYWIYMENLIELN